MRRTLLTVSYDGTNYAGWQRQQNAVSVQQVLEEALGKLLNREVSTIGGGRTDAGVHALGQKALIREPIDIFIPTEKLPAAVNAYLPQDIRVLGAETVTPDFHPLRRPARKTYIYKIFNAPVMPPVYRLYAAFERRGLDVLAMMKAAVFFVGTHDFRGFSSTGTEVQTTVRDIYALDVVKTKDMISITASGNGFLYNMVRIIAGTLLYVGLGKINADDIPEIIKSGDRNRAGKTMPAHGLILHEIEYIF
ncbi:MAG: tRNA pseudouridine(38-40) synthase TruA [Defluviitaleaceae bacterium]|nr:tRNA pseudouridine(38-40) synthase TruA [Defluviitaleaceae bacterium]MCL2835687.1 tRNA pseudouridine(38-40) synthase TruA [Defluviitaleaceae bacterium]